jgi:hypothetical protein
MLASNPSEHSERSDLLRGLGLRSAIAIVIGDTIGTGVFLVASDMARAVGSATLVLIAWILGLLIVLLGAFCYAELGAAFPKAGGPYVYLGRGLGPLWGFLFGWMSSFLERPVAMATLAAGFVRFIGFLFPTVATPLFSSHIGSYEFTFTTAQPVAALIVVIVTAVNFFSVRMGGAIQVLLTSLKMGTILVIVVGGVVFGTKHAGSTGPAVTSFSWGTIGALLTALVPAMWAYNGFNDLGDLGEEIVRPQKNIPRAIIFGLLTVGGLYLMANVVYFHVLPFAQVAASPHVASDVVQSLSGSRGARRGLVHGRHGCVSSWGAARRGLDRRSHPIRHGARRFILPFRGAPSSFPSYAHRRVGFPGLDRRAAGAHGDVRGIVFTVCFCRVDLFWSSGDCPDTFTPKRAEPGSALPRLGISLDSAHLLGCRDGFDGQLVDGPARTFLARVGSDCSRYSVLLPLAQTASFS